MRHPIVSYIHNQSKYLTILEKYNRIEEKRHDAKNLYKLNCNLVHNNGFAFSDMIIISISTYFERCQGTEIKRPPPVVNKIAIILINLNNMLYAPLAWCICHGKVMVSLFDISGYGTHRI